MILNINGHGPVNRVTFHETFLCRGFLSRFGGTGQESGQPLKNAPEGHNAEGVAITVHNINPARVGQAKMGLSNGSFNSFYLQTITTTKN